MDVLLPGVLAAALHTIAFVIELNALRRREPDARRRLLPIVAAGATAHGIAAYGLLTGAGVVSLDLLAVLALVSVVIIVVALLLSVRHPVDALFLLILPLAATSLVAALAVREPPPPRVIPPAVLAHAALSLVAYAVLALAAGQAVLLAIQERLLRSARSLHLLRLLPPLAVMENVLFELLWTGLFTLSLAIVSGLLFLDDMFAQHVVHHAVLSMSSWVVFAILLWGRHALGWRGITAIRWTLAGFGLLVLAYFGSKFVLEVLLAG